MTEGVAILTAEQIEDLVYVRYISALHERLARRYEPLIVSLETANILRPRYLPLGDQYSVRGVLMRGILEPLVIRQIRFDRSKLRMFFRRHVGNIVADVTRKTGEFAADRFTSLFSRLARHEDVQSAIQIDWTTKEFVLRLARQAQITLPRSVDDRFPDAFVMQLRKIAIEALIAGIVDTGGEVTRWYISEYDRYHSLAAIEIRRTQSYLDDVGALRFKVANEQVSLSQDGAAATTHTYSRLIQSSINRIERQEILKRIDNQDPVLAGYVTEYIMNFKDYHDDENILTLTSIIQLMSRQVGINLGRSREEQVDPSLIAQIDMLVANHALYSQSFNVINQAAKDQERASELYSKLNSQERLVPWSALSSLILHENMFEDRSKKALDKLNSAISSTIDDPNKVIIFLGSGALRGSLKALAGVVLDEADKIEAKKSPEPGLGPDLIKEAGKESIRALVKGIFQEGSLAGQCLRYFHEHALTLMNLAASLQPYFEWVIPFLRYVKNLWG